MIRFTTVLLVRMVQVFIVDNDCGFDLIVEVCHSNKRFSFKPLRTTVKLTEIIKKEAKPRQNDTSQGTIGADGQVFIFDNDAVRLDFTKFVIQQALPFNHFDNVKLTEIIKRRLQPRPEEFTNFDILAWWKERKIQFPILSAMARDLLTVQASTVASESAFSISGRIISERRSRLTPESVEVCVCLKDYLDGVDRVQHETSLEGPILEDVEETIAREEVDLGISPPNTELDEGEFEDLDIEHVDVEDFLEDLMD
ncbi:zinc finger BED domain-containing protein RICESLEEPER 2 [Tanacetum coccineum]